MPGVRVALRVLASLAIVSFSLGVPAGVAAATDTDRDGLPDTFEPTLSLTDPRRADTDRDGIKDGAEDPDHDGLTNRQEYVAQTHPRRADTDHDGIRDDREDPDRDGLQNRFEFLAGTHPLRYDTDRDGLPDGSEDPDRDGLVNRQEQSRGTLPRVADTDHDGYLDGEEAVAGTNPRSATSHPTAPTAPPPTVPGADCQILPSDNVWNVPVDGLTKRFLKQATAVHNRTSEARSGPPDLRGRVSYERRPCPARSWYLVEASTAGFNSSD